MAFLRGLIALPLIVVVVLFAVTHTEKVPVSINPFESAVEYPLYVVALGFLAVGFLLGAMIAWISMSKLRRENRARGKKIKKLEKELALSQGSHGKGSGLNAVTDLTPIEDQSEDKKHG